jgi:putative spermidine/putrescine transport system ATP-binding protein
VGNLSLYRVTKRFGTSVYALNNVSIDITSGELVAVLGSSGCGKTTLLRVVAGLEQADTGQVVLNGQDITSLATRRRPIGMMVQSYALFPNMTVKQNIAFPLMTRKRSQTLMNQRVDELLELVQLTEQRDRYPNQLSGGQQQRTALARALAASPEVLLLDEPLSALDALVRQQLREQIRQIQQTLQITTLFVTHDQSEAMAIADRVAVMSQGKLEQVASPFELYETPTTQFSASFIGSRNALELSVQNSRIQFGNIFSLSTSDATGKRVMVFFRPEDVEFSNGDRGQPAIVKNKTFQGPFTRLQLSVKVKAQIVQFYADLPTRQASDIPVNSTVHVHVNPECVKIFPVDN